MESGLNTTAKKGTVLCSLLRKGVRIAAAFKLRKEAMVVASFNLRK